MKICDCHFQKWRLAAFTLKRGYMAVITVVSAFISIAFVLRSMAAVTPVVVIVNQDTDVASIKKALVCSSASKTTPQSTLEKYTWSGDREIRMACDGSVDIVAIVTNTRPNPWEGVVGRRSVLNALHWYKIERIVRSEGRNTADSVLEFSTQPDSSPRSSNTCRDEFSDGSWKVTESHLDVCRHLIAEDLHSAMVLEVWFNPESFSAVARMLNVTKHMTAPS